MKLSLIPVAILLCSLSAEGRDFTSSDGSKTLTAEFVRYNNRSGQVTLQLANGRNLVTDATFFSKGDQAYFVEEGKKSAIDDALRVDANKDSDHISQDYGQMRVRRKKVTYSFEVDNTSAYPLENLELKYWVLVERNQGKSKNELIKGSSKINQLEGGAEQVISGPELMLTVGARSTCDCPKVAEAAAKIGRDDIVGERIEVRTADGKLIHAKSSSRKVDDAIEGK